jgi:phosphoribosylformylglycinamidine cyclo-ligase
MTRPTYKQAGVDLELYQRAMQRLPALLGKTHTSRVMDLPGGFAGLFRLNSDQHQYQDPVLVSGTDGVGTKIKVAILAQQFDSIGIDLVAMCVNDCLCLGAEPLLFLDYIAMSHDDPDLLADLVAGVSEGCVQAGAALLGGETAIMPDLYSAGDFDMAGFCVGVAERSGLVDGSQIGVGDCVLGLPSHGFHSNGYSLIRKVVFEHAGLKIDSQVPALGASVAEVLLRPTRIYAREIRALIADHADHLHGIAHITGGGLQENIERILPDGQDVAVGLRKDAWNVPSEMVWLQELGQIAEDEMYRVFNMGIGMVLIVSAEARLAIASTLSEFGSEVIDLGVVTSAPRGVVWQA